jgi:hypothetical protein
VITFVNFLWLIHFLLIGLYCFTIGQYGLSRYRNPGVYKALPVKVPGAQMKYWESISEGVMVIAGAHIVFFGIAVEAVPLFLIMLVIGSVFADVQFETAKAYIQIIDRHKASAQPGAGGPQGESYQGNDGDFGFDEGAWNGRQGRGKASASGGAPDYASALRDAQQEANKISDDKAAKFAKVWGKLAKEKGLDPKIRLFRELVAMLLSERAKGFKGRPDQSEPTQNEITKLISVRPKL